MLAAFLHQFYSEGKKIKHFRQNEIIPHRKAEEEISSDWKDYVMWANLKWKLTAQNASNV